MSSGMNMQEAEKVAEKMSYRQAVINCLYARCVPYRKATKIKMQQLIEIAEKQDEKIKHDKQIRADAIEGIKELVKSRLIISLGLEDATKYGNKNAKQQANSYATVMRYEIADCVDDLLDDLEQMKEQEE